LKFAYLAGHDRFHGLEVSVDVTTATWLGVSGTVHISLLPPVAVGEIKYRK
jgi:hypothetical protein